jgi:nucleoside-diphosphate-sugar epimerase
VRVFVAGAAGIIGRELVPLLVAAGHDVTGTTHSTERARWLTDAGAKTEVVDAYDADALRGAVVRAAPEVVIHQLTDLAGGFRPADLAATARLRAEGTRNLVDAALAAGAERMVAQSGAWLYADGPVPHRETDPLIDPEERPDSPVIPGILALERLVTRTPGLEGIVLRYGFFYGGETGTDRDAQSRPRVSVPAAARATVLAMEHGQPGAVYNVVDDDDPTVSNALAREAPGWVP